MGDNGDPEGHLRVGSDDAFLALDRDGNGTIDNGAELFGNFTPQPEASPKHGFLALASFDETIEDGGNGDGLISALDAVYGQLVAWVDANHDGFSDSEEILSLDEAGIESIDLDYRESRKKDPFKNEYRYRARAYYSDGSHAWAYDVLLLRGS